MAVTGEAKRSLEEFYRALINLRDSLDIASKGVRIKEIEERMSKGDFWKDPDAQKVIANLKELKGITEPFVKLEENLSEASILLELAEEAHDEVTRQEGQHALEALARDLRRFELCALFAGPHDAANAYLSIHAGAGGTESCDWAAMLLRMYLRWAERNGYASEILDSVEGEEAGLRSVTAILKGHLAYGYLASEIGVHRLVRISPFDSNKRRHTSFASVDALPEIEEQEIEEPPPGDLRIDTYRSSGAGGQHVNKTSSAVRITHLPTGIVVACQNERSQHKNRKVAMRMLVAKLQRRRAMEREAELAKKYDEKGEIAWGNQIRSYVLQPYQLVKDHRTEYQTSDVVKVLDGELDAFMEAYLRARGGKNGRDRASA
ncbi:MAG: peptide chain release factor 2 [Planctomycetota bacterium]